MHPNPSMCEIANSLLMYYKTEALGSYLDSVPPAYHTHKWADLSLFQLSNGSNMSFLIKNLKVSILMLLLTILNHSLKVLFLWVWDLGVQIIYDITQECRERFRLLCCCAPSTVCCWSVGVVL